MGLGSRESRREWDRQEGERGQERDTERKIYLEQEREGESKERTRTETDSEMVERKKRDEGSLRRQRDTWETEAKSWRERPEGSPVCERQAEVEQVWGLVCLGLGMLGLGPCEHPASHRVICLDLLNLMENRV